MQKSWSVFDLTLAPALFIYAHSADINCWIALYMHYNMTSHPRNLGMNCTRFLRYGFGKAKMAHLHFDGSWIPCEDTGKWAK